MFQLFVVDDHTREALGGHPPLPHVIGADGGEVGTGRRSLALSSAKVSPFFCSMSTMTNRVPPAAEQGVGSHAVPVGARLDGAEGVGDGAFGTPLIDETGEHVHDGDREVAVGGPARVDVVLVVRFIGVAR